MSKRKKHRAAIKTATPDGLTPTPGPLAPMSVNAGRPRRWLTFGILAVTLIGGWGLFAAYENDVWPFHERETVIRGTLLKNEKSGDLLAALKKANADKPQEKWKIEAFVPTSEDDKVIDRLVTLMRDKKVSAFELLAKLPDDDVIVSEAEFERRAAGDFLRKKDVRVIDVWRGEPDASGKPRPSARRYVLVMKGTSPTPRLRVRDRAGRVSAPEYFTLIDPVIVVEVQGKDVKTIQPMRTELNKRP